MNPAPMDSWFPFNINDWARVKLTREGIHQFYAWHERLGLVTDGPDLDAEGWHQSPLWNIMSIWGEKLHMGGPLMFETAILLKGAPSPPIPSRL